MIGSVQTREGIAGQVPSDEEMDPRFKTLLRTMRQYQYRPDSLIEVLHKVQELYGYLDKELLLSVARLMQLPPSHVYGVATFYNFFSLEPKGEHTCEVCMGTTCYMKGSRDLLKALERRTGIRAGQTTPDGKVSLSIVRCPGTCGVAPVVYIDGMIAGQGTTPSAMECLDRWIK
jgi:bidirectional [NiFe] hydrogenase diaphorase subunit